MYTTMALVDYTVFGIVVRKNIGNTIPIRGVFMGGAEGAAAPLK